MLIAQSRSSVVSPGALENSDAPWVLRLPSVEVSVKRLALFAAAVPAAALAAVGEEADGVVEPVVEALRIRRAELEPHAEAALGQEFGDLAVEFDELFLRQAESFRA